MDGDRIKFTAAEHVEKYPVVLHMGCKDVQGRRMSNELS